MTSSTSTATLADDHAAKAKSREYAVIALIGFAHSISHFFHLVLPSLFPLLMQEYHLSFTAIGATTSVFFVVSGVGQAGAGFAVDRFGAWKVLLFGLGCLVLAALLLSLVGGYGGLFIAAALAGLGNCIFHPADFTVLNRHVSKPRLGHAFSVHGLSGSLGWALAPVFMVGIATLAGWRVAALAAAGLGFLAWLAVFLGRRLLADPPATHAPVNAEHAAQSTFAFLRVLAVWLCFAFFFFTTNTVGVFQNFGAPLMQHIYGLSFTLATMSLSVFMLGSAGGMVFGGFLVGRGSHHDRRIALVLTSAAALALVLASGWLPTWLVLPTLALMGFCNGIAGPSRDMLVRQVAAARFGQQAFGRVYGFVYSGLDLGMALAPLLFGPLMDHGQFSSVLIGVAVFQTAAVLTALRVSH